MSENRYILSWIAGWLVAIGLMLGHAFGQDIPNHSMPVGGGPGVVGWKTLGPCAAGQVGVWATGVTADPTCGFPGTGGVLSVTNGGTGNSSFTLNSVLTGNGTSPISTVGPGLTGQALMGVTGSPPAFSGAPSFTTSVTAPFVNASTTSNGNGFQLGGTTFAFVNGNYTEILSPPSQTSAAILMIGNATDPENYFRGNVVFQTLTGVQTGNVSNNGSLSLGGSTPAVNGVVKLSGSTSGTITIQPQAAAGTYNFNLPTTAGTAGQVLTSQGGGSSAMTWSSGIALSAPQVTVLVSGSALTYTTPVNALYLIVEAVGGGGGGGGNGSAGGTSGGTGGNTTFSGGVISLTANGGTGGAVNNGGAPPASVAGGTASGGDINFTGNPTSTYFTTAVPIVTTGASSIYGGAGAGGGSNLAGNSASTNSGSGGGGAGNFAGTAGPGGGGAAGGYTRKLITSPNATFTYSVGGGGTAGTAGTGGHAGGTGGGGIIIVTAYFQ